MYGLRMLPIIATILLVAPVTGAADVSLDDLPVTATADSQTAVTAGGETFYVVLVGPMGTAPEGVELWQESNDCAKLQRQDGFVGGVWCVADTNLGATP